MSDPSLLVASYSTVKSFDAVRKFKRGYRFPCSALAKWRERHRKERKERRRRAKQVEMNWMNIEHVAAGKIQAFCRRFLDRESLERHGMTTSSMRNMIRQRKMSPPQRIITDDVPFLFRHCGIGLVFGGIKEVDDDDLSS